METPVQKPISELSEALEALGTDKLLIQTANGTKIIQASILAPALLSLLVGDSAASHNAIYRGKSLGSSFTSAQSAAIRSANSPTSISATTGRSTAGTGASALLTTGIAAATPTAPPTTPSLSQIRSCTPQP